MQCCDSNQATSFIHSSGFAVSAVDEIGDEVLEPNICFSASQCVSAKVKLFADDLPFFVYTFMECLPNNAGRFLWIDRFLSAQPSLVPTLEALRKADNELRSPYDVRGHYFPKECFSVPDYAEMSREQEYESDLFVSLMCLALLSGWHAKVLFLVPTSYVQLWEGNIFFYSSEPHRVFRATEVFNNYDLSKATD
ncbi:hypothetical protein E4Z66_17280 [Aliishimia ponticola]|uniref:Uncharacterized protein n=1 Tax=Aliishimia ponticola TaxID=2499833 RepID=A0A4S4N9P3_9RHOB|nr:hypothetical protein [Aliishimia ponticola]THH34721.1 hypothetical protein E4Z66_17280 [Aliishimia ponticola]